ncbi:hypothetical protein N8005_04860 [Litorivicinus sp.]|jgi:hypothetical protein|nr:hypothetical protein [Litorivicinus sp.]
MMDPTKEEYLLEQAKRVTASFSKTAQNTLRQGFEMQALLSQANPKDGAETFQKSDVEGLTHGIFQLAIKRALNAKDIAEQAISHALNGESILDVKKAVDKMCDERGKDGDDERPLMQLTAELAFEKAMESFGVELGLELTDERNDWAEEWADIVLKAILGEYRDQVTKN